MVFSASVLWCYKISMLVGTVAETVLFWRCSVSIRTPIYIFKPSSPKRCRWFAEPGDAIGAESQRLWAGVSGMHGHTQT